MGSTRNHMHFVKKSESDAKRVPAEKVKIFRSDRERDKELNQIKNVLDAYSQNGGLTTFGGGRNFYESAASQRSKTGA